MEQKKNGNRWIALVVCLLMLSSLFVPFNVQEANAAESKLQNPRQAADGTVTWDCVYFGHYPQSSDGNGGFNKDPIKWRVLSVNGQDAFLMADKNLDGGIPYNETFTGVTWETCTLRSWLNGYGSSINKEGEDYTSDNFIDRAFTSSEQNAIRQTTVVNEDNPENHTEGGNNTQDKVYLLSIGEAKNPEYGFPAHDNSSETRKAVNTAYTASKSYMNNVGYRNWWWLRSPGYDANNASNVTSIGIIYSHGHDVDDSRTGVRPALHLNLSSNLWSYAGTVSSDGTVDEQVTKTITGTLQGVDYLGFSIRIDGKSYPTSDGFDMTKALEIYNEHENKVVAAYLVNGEITTIDDVADVMRISLHLSSDIKNLNYQNENWQEESIPAKITLKSVAMSPYDTSALQKLQNQEITSLYAGTLHLETLYAGAYLKKGSWLSPNEQAVDMEVNTTLKAGEIKEIPFEVYMDDEYVPELVTENWSVKGRISVNGESDSHTLSFSAGNLDLQKAQQEAAKVERESAKALSEAKQELDGLKIATDATLRQYFSAAQVESINKCVTTWIGGLIATSNMIRDDSNGVIDGVLKEAGLSGNAMMSAVLGKMGVNENVFTKFSKTAATTKIIATDKNGKNAEIYYSVDLNYNSFKDAPPYAGFGTLDYYIILDNGKKVKAMAKGQVAYTNMDAFADQLQKVAEGSIKAVYNKAWGNNANKVAELIVGKTISSVLNKTVGTFSDNVFTLLKLPSQRSAVKTKTLRASSAPAEESQVEYAKEVTLTGPGDVYVLDAEGKICGAITADTVDSSYNAVHLYANSQEKRIYLTEDDYTIQIVGTETGSMDYTIKEFANGTLLRSIEYKALSLRNGNGYYSTIPDAVYLDNAVYHPVSDTKKVIGAEKDTWQDHMAKQVSTSGLTFDQSKVSLSVGQQLQLNAKVKPDNATNKEVNWTCKNKAVATVSETGLVKGLAEGSTVIQAETADGGFIAECTVTVNKKLPQTITAANITKPYGSKPFPLNAKTSGGGKLTYKSGNPAVATVSSTGMVTAKGPGKAVITISAAATTNYNAATKNITITVTKAKQTITGASSFTKTYGNKPFGLGAKAKTKLTYKSSSTKVARVSSAGKVTLKGPGKATITITAAANGNYNAATKRVAITVKPKKPAAPKVKSTRSRTLKVSWKRDTKATGYQAVIAQNKKFTKGKKTATITKNKTTGKTFKKLKRKKTYYAKVRAYKKVGSTKLYGSYSKVKKVRVR